MAKETTFTVVKVLDVSADKINQLYKNKSIQVKSEYPNTFIVFKADEQQSALTRVDSTGNSAVLISDKLKASGIKPRNKEQYMALDMLMDPSVTVNTITGKAGSGKTLITLAAALEQVNTKNYKRIILTRPMSQVGKYSLGTLPGEVNEKFMPYLGNFETNLSQLAGKDIDYLMRHYDIECLPIQLMRGCSFTGSFIIVDEIQVLPPEDVLTIGTRVGEGSKIVFLGDLDQRDEKIAIPETGLYKLFNSTTAKESPLVGAIELIKVERSATALLFTNIFSSSKGK